MARTLKLFHEIVLQEFQDHGIIINVLSDVVFTSSDILSIQPLEIFPIP